MHHYNFPQTTLCMYRETINRSMSTAKSDKTGGFKLSKSSITQLHINLTCFPVRTFKLGIFNVIWVILGQNLGNLRKGEWMRG